MKGRNRSARFRGERGVSRGTVATIVFITSVVAVLGFNSLKLESAKCEVCMEFQGRSKCRTVGAKTPEEARQAAIDNACAFISGGVTDRMSCARGVPTSESCQ